MARSPSSGASCLRPLGLEGGEQFSPRGLQNSPGGLVPRSPSLELNPAQMNPDRSTVAQKRGGSARRADDGRGARDPPEQTPLSRLATAAQRTEAPRPEIRLNPEWLASPRRFGAQYNRAGAPRWRFFRNRLTAWAPPLQNRDIRRCISAPDRRRGCQSDRPSPPPKAGLRRAHRG